MKKSRLKILACVGTRPEAIKMAPVILKLGKAPWAHLRILSTAQHREMLDQVLDFFDITPDIDLNLMKPNQTLAQLTSRISKVIDSTIQKEKPDLVLVQGDTTTVFIIALCCFYHRIKIGHIEAGLRTHNKFFPYPEEMNRRLTGYLTDIHFAPTDRAKQNLLAEGVDKKSIYITGNTVIDALLLTAQRRLSCPVLLDRNKRLILVTAHRRESFGEPFVEICQALLDLVSRNSDIEIVYPVHLNPNIKKVAHKLLSNHSRIHLISPQPYPQFVALMKNAYLILTDSGGIQEEAPSLGKPVLVLRNETERPEAIKAGTSRLVGTKRQQIVKETELLLRNQRLYKTIAKTHNPYGDGKASDKIVRIIKNYFQNT